MILQKVIPDFEDIRTCSFHFLSSAARSMFEMINVEGYLCYSKESCAT